MNKCPVCNKKSANWLHKISCREHNPLAWLLFDFIRAKDSIERQIAVKSYLEVAK